MRLSHGLFQADTLCISFCEGEGECREKRCIHLPHQINWLRFCRYMEFTFIDMEIMLIDSIRWKWWPFWFFFSLNALNTVSYLIRITDEWAPIHWNQVDKSIWLIKTKIKTKTTQKKYKLNAIIFIWKWYFVSFLRRDFHQQIQNKKNTHKNYIIMTISGDYCTQIRKINYLIIWVIYMCSFCVCFFSTFKYILFLNSISHDFKIYSVCIQIKR